MIYNKNNLVIAAAAGKEKDNRPELSGVLFKKDRTVATDGFILVEVKNQPEETNRLAEEFPPLPDKTKPLADFKKAGYIIPAADVDKAAKDLSKVKNSNLPVLDNCILAASNQNEYVRLASTDLERVNTITAKTIDEQFPDYERIIPGKLDYDKSKVVSIKLLKRVLMILEKMELSRDDVRIYWQDKNDPLVIKKETTGGQEVTALVMPLKD